VDLECRIGAKSRATCDGYTKLHVSCDEKTTTTRYVCVHKTAYSLGVERFSIVVEI